MRGNPVRNFICVLLLLLVMAAGVAVTTHRGGGLPTTGKPNPEKPHKKTTVLVRMLFSHPPEKVIIPGFQVDGTSEENELEFSLTLPAEVVTELPLDIRWKDQDGANYFTQITIRQDGKEDDVIVFTDQSTEFFDTFSIDTRTKKP